jgi:hypothetical protein
MAATSKRQVVPRQIVQRTSEAAEHRPAVPDAYNFAKRLKTPRGLTPYEHICNAWADSRTDSDTIRPTS